MHLSDPWYKVRHHLIMHRQGGRGVCVCVGGGESGPLTSSRIFKVIVVCLTKYESVIQILNLCQI